MKRTTRTHTNRAARRRGVTLIEMLVTVAMLVIIMTILVQVFQAATGALSAAQAYQGIDDQLRRVDGLLRSDLEGVTARFTPPLDPALGLGYFEYGENEFADVQGEDSDDYIRFTAKAPEGRPFTGRMWVPLEPIAGAYNVNAQPVTITSDFAEIIYFLRNGNLYRRVLLVAPQLQSSISQVVNNHYRGNFAFFPGQLGNTTPPVTWGGAATAGATVPVSWQGVNDLSARPAVRGPATNVTTAAVPNSIILNTLGDLTNRENRFASPRFSDDFFGIAAANTPDGLSDDLNSDNVPDYYPTLYPGLFSSAAGTATQLIFEPLYLNPQRRAQVNASAMPFPFVFPGAYSIPQSLTNYAYGWIHAPSPFANVPQAVLGNCTATAFDGSPLAYLQSMNHNPIDIGDNLPTPNNPPITAGAAGAALAQSWWGFPTARETLSPSWNDPGRQVNDNVNFANFGQPAGLTPRLTNGTAGGASGLIGVADDADLLPPMTVPNGFPAGVPFTLIRRSSQPFCDGAGGHSVFMGGATVGQAALWSQSWEDDLVMTGVRSFDVKAYDNALATYADLGWGDDFRIIQQANDGNYNPATAHYTPPTFPTRALPKRQLRRGRRSLIPRQLSSTQTARRFNLLTQTFAHEGRMPPLITDNILDAQYPNPFYINTSAAFPSLPSPFTHGYVQQYTNVNFTANTVQDTYNFTNYSSNVGDNNNGVIRMRRVWDSWSTEYSRAPANGVYNNPANPPTIGNPPAANPNADALNGTPWGPNGGTPPIYPSYPPPYPAPLRGIQIQIRVTDPANQRIKSLTIRQDFTDKL